MIFANITFQDSKKDRSLCDEQDYELILLAPSWKGMGLGR